MLREGEHGFVLCAQLGCPVIHGQLLPEHWVAGELADRRAMRDEAVVAVVFRRHHHGDHLPLKLTEGRIRQHEIVVESDEGTELLRIERVGLKDIRNEAELLPALPKVFREIRTQGLIGKGRQV